jgi:phosphatidylethanolamine-binding protein (PEBP) family uncharacterized protein
MKRWLTIMGILVAILIGGGLALFRKQPNQSPQGETMQLTSSVFQNNQYIPAQYTCDGENINPPLQISDVPAQAHGLVLIMHDPDAPVGDFLHWTA